MQQIKSFIITAALGCLLLSTACTKVETQIVKGNNPPQDSTIDNVLKDNFIQKVYIDVIGRTPTNLEKIGARTVIDKNNCSKENRDNLISQLMAMADFKDHLYNIDNAGLLKSNSDMVIGYYITYYAGLMNDSSQKAAHNGYVEDVNRLKILRRTYQNFLTDSIDLVEVHKRMTFNPLYDALIGGEYAWANASFPYFLMRKPTTDEMTNIYYMFSGFQGQLFLKSGTSKSEYINIFFESNEYFEGQIRSVYLRYLFREPTAAEVASLTPIYKKDHNITDLLKNIFLSDEYLGVK